MHDLAVIGAGWAGFNAALKAKQSGVKVCLIDPGKIGGTCLNRGCIPTKALIAGAKVYSLATKSLTFGVEAQNPRLNFSLMQENKNKVVSLLEKGMQSRLTGIDFINAPAQIKGPGKILAANQLIEAKFILVATGSVPRELPQLKFDQEHIISSDQALELAQVPKNFLIIGGGFIGCEFAGLFSTLGSAVTLVEKMPLLLPGEDREVSRKLEAVFKKKGVKVMTGTEFEALNLDDYDKVLVCVGRSPNTASLGLEEAGVELEKGRIRVDDYLQTKIKGIYAAGDCASQIMLAHYAAYQGVAAVNNMFGTGQVKADNRIVPSCIFTEPQIASVGLKENAEPDPGIKAYKFDFRASGMAQIHQETDGWVKILADEKSGRIAGASIVGPQATELIATLTVAVSSNLTVEQFKKVIFAHPTFSESLVEALK